jgi:hydroxymethylpyrimidine pyrophosphatase-like HAD family hydrolase
MLTSGIRVSHNKVLEALCKIEGFDQSAFTKLTIDTSPSTVLEILAQFRKTLEQARLDLLSGQTQKSDEIISKVCHKLRGSSELLGFIGFSKSLSHVRAEMKKYPENAVVFENGVDELILSCDSLAAYLDAHCSYEITKDSNS